MAFTTARSLNAMRAVYGYPPLEFVVTVHLPPYDLEFSMAEGTLQRYRGTDTSFAHWRDDWEWIGSRGQCEMGADIRRLWRDLEREPRKLQYLILPPGLHAVFSGVRP